MRDQIEPGRRSANATPPYALVVTLRGFLDYTGITRPKGERNWLQKLIDRRRAR